MGKNKKSKDSQIGSSSNNNTESEAMMDDKLDSDYIRKLIREEMPNFIRELLREEMSSVSKKLDDLVQSMSFISHQYDTIKESLAISAEKISSLVAERDELRSTVTDLTCRIQSMEQFMRESNLEINGIPEHKLESLPNLITQLSNTVKNPIVPNEILSCKRVAKMNKESKYPRAVVVKLMSPLRRDDLLAAVIRFNKENSTDRLNSHHLGIGGEKKQVYVSEHLSPANKLLHAETRKVSKEKGYKFTWVRNGHIFVRKNETSQSIHITNIEKLSSL